MDAAKMFYYVAFLFSLGSVAMMATSLTTEHTMEATIVDLSGEAAGFIQLGLFRGRKEIHVKDTGLTEPQYFLIVDEYSDLFHPLITYVNIILTGLAVHSALITAMLTLENIIKDVPFKSVAGPIGLFFFNMFGAVLSMIALLIFSSVIYGTLQGDITSTAEKEAGYSSGDLAFGYSFWLQIGSTTLLSMNFGNIIFAQMYAKPEKNENTLHLLTKTKQMNVL